MVLPQARHNVFILDTRTWSYGATLRIEDDTPSVFSFAANHLTVGTIRGKLNIFGLEHGNFEGTITAFSPKLGRSVISAAYSPDGRLLAAVPGDPLLNSPVVADPIRIWRPQTGELIATFSSNSEAFKQLAWSPDGNLLAAAGDKRALTIWNVTTRKSEIFQPLGGNLFAAGFSRDGILAAAAGDDVVVLH
jgi:WD40 repeat protein